MANGHSGIDRLTNKASNSELNKRDCLATDTLPSDIPYGNNSRKIQQFIQTFFDY